MEGFQAKPAQLKRYLKQINNSIEQYSSYLGRLAFQEYLHGSLPNQPLQKACRILADLNEQRSRIEKEIAHLEQMRQAAKYPRCPFCGAPIPPGAPVCQACGRAMVPAAPGMPPSGAPPFPAPGAMPYAPAPTSPPTETQSSPVSQSPTFPPPAGEAPTTSLLRITCAGCGADLEADNAFCTNCGRPVGAEEEETVSTTEKASETPPGEPGVAPTPPPSDEDQSIAKLSQTEMETSPPATESLDFSQPLPQEPPASPPVAGGEESRCSFCGEILEADAAFCTNCGRPVAPKAGKEETASVSGISPGTPGAVPSAASVVPAAGPENSPPPGFPFHGGTPSPVSVPAPGPEDGPKCPRCWTPPADPEAIFCTGCGTRLR